MQGSWLRAPGSGLRDPGFGFRVPGFGFRVQRRLQQVASLAFGAAYPSIFFLIYFFVYLYTSRPPAHEKPGHTLVNAVGDCPNFSALSLYIRVLGDV